MLSDTQGVDLGPYLACVWDDVRENWYRIIPQSARPPLMKKGKVSIEFAILRNGSVQGMKLAGGVESGSSGDVSLDRAAWGGITDALTGNDGGLHAGKRTVVKSGEKSGSNSAVECDLAKVEVAGSNPVSRSRLFNAVFILKTALLRIGIYSCCAVPDFCAISFASSVI